jgi:hypothetical protein
VGPGLVLHVVGGLVPDLAQGLAEVLVEHELPRVGVGGVHVDGVLAGGHLLAADHHVAVEADGRHLVLARPPHAVRRQLLEQLVERTAFQRWTAVVDGELLAGDVRRRGSAGVLREGRRGDGCDQHGCEASQTLGHGQTAP